MRSIHQNYPAPTLRRRLLVALLAIATAITIGWLMIYRVGGVKPKAPPPPPDVQRCAAGQQEGCVGGRAAVIVLSPPATTASRP